MEDPSLQLSERSEGPKSTHGPEIQALSPPSERPKMQPALTAPAITAPAVKLTEPKPQHPPHGTVPTTPMEVEKKAEATVPTVQKTEHLGPKPDDFYVLPPASLSVLNETKEPPSEKTVAMPDQRQNASIAKPVQSPPYYVIQLAAFLTPQEAHIFYEKNQSDFSKSSALKLQPLSIRQTTWHVVYCGQFDTKAKAVVALKNLPPKWKQSGAWIRKIEKMNHE